MFKPQLLPNNPAGESPDWESRIENPTDWLYSNKYDGARIELFHDGTVKGRSLKALPSAHINRMGKDIALILQMNEGTVMECEFYSPNMTFSEIMHFFKTEDVTSEKTKVKYQKLWTKTGGDPEKGWKYPGRDVEWLTTWHDSLKFYAFGIVSVNALNTPFVSRVIALDRYVTKYTNAMEDYSKDLVMVKQVPFEHIDQLYQAYDQAIIDDLEGLVVMHKQSMYKCGRHTLNAKQAFKIKEDNVEFDGQIIAVEEATEAREGAAKTTNELGRSVTSKLKEDRVPSGMAKGFKVQMEDGNTPTISLNGYNHEERRELLENASDYVGKWIRFTGMKPVKPGGCPRSAHFTAGNFRDEK